MQPPSGHAIDWLLHISLALHLCLLFAACCVYCAETTHRPSQILLV